MKGMIAWIFLGTLLIGSVPAYAEVMGACGDRPLPSGKTRRVRDIHLECSSSVDHYVRRPIPFDVNEWRRLEKLGDRNGMQDFRQQESLIQWSGTIPYDVVEVWEWTDWVYGKDSSCGYDTVDDGEDEDGNRITHQEMRSCWHDEDEYEVRSCSTEVMNFSAEFIRPGKPQWNPSTPGYYDVIPNKYDLLPGELEVVQVYTNDSRSRRVTPTGAVGDAWNKYQFTFNIHGYGAQAPCQFNHTYDMAVTVDTVGRNTNKTTPNAFRMPVDRFGKEVKPLSWEETMNSKREYVHNRPIEVKLSDVSSTIITSMARQTRKFTDDLEKAKQEAGLGESASAEETKEHQEASGFWKDTRVRIQLYEVVWLGRDRRSTHNLYTSGSDVAVGEHYKIDLTGSTPQGDLFRASGPIMPSFWEQFKFNLRPNTQYEMHISMYQKGVPFYAQDCESRPGWDCRTFGRPESYYYSKSLPIPFEQKTDKYLDDRSGAQKFVDWQGRKW